MENETVEMVTVSMGITRDGWKGIIFNLSFILYYFVYCLVVDESYTVNS